MSTQLGEIATVKHIEALERKIDALESLIRTVLEPRDRLLTVEQAADLLQVTKQTVWKSIAAGHYTNHGRAGRKLLRESEIILKRRK